MDRRSWSLVTLCVVPAIAEAAILAGTGFTSAAGLAPQVTATPAFGVFHDLRWLMVFHRSVPGFVLELVLLTALRSLLMTGIVLAAWPSRAPGPSPRAVFRRCVPFVVTTMVLLSPSAVLAMAAAELSLSWFFFGEMLPILLLGIGFVRGGIVPGWWRGLPPVTAIGWFLLSFACATAGAAAVGLVGRWWAIPVSGAFGLVNAWLWRGLVHSVVRGKPRLARVPSVPIAFVLSVIGLALVGQLLTIGQPSAVRPIPESAADGGPVPHTVVYVGGYDSRFHPEDGDGPHVIHFSYRGTDSRGLPRRYDSLSTHQSLARSAHLLEQQVATAHRRTGRPVALVGQSEGTLVIRGYLTSYPHSFVDTVILLSPLVQAGRIYYPPADRRSGDGGRRGWSAATLPPPERDHELVTGGWGIVPGWELRGMLSALRLTSGSRLSAGEPMVRSLLDHPVAYRNTMLCPVPGMRTLVFLPAVSAAVVPPGVRSRVPAVVVLGLHASLLAHPRVQQQVAAFLAGQDVERSVPWWYPVARAAGAAWQAPALPLGLNPVWRAGGLPDTAFGEDGCTGASPHTP